MGSTNQYIEKPDWMYEGVPPEPRVFTLVESVPKKKIRLLTKRLTYRDPNIVSNLHCEPTDAHTIYELKPVFLNATARKSTSNRSISGMSKGMSKAMSKSRRSQIYTLNRTRRQNTRRNSSANDINVGGGKKRKTKRRRNKK